VWADCCGVLRVEGESAQIFGVIRNNKLGVGGVCVWRCGSGAGGQGDWAKVKA